MSSFRTLCDQAIERKERADEQLDDSIRNTHFNENFDDLDRLRQIMRELGETLAGLKEYANCDEYDAAFKDGNREARDEIRDSI